jgi:23S rRNA (pseudouridine1915-N3)-methyltransferase
VTIQLIYIGRDKKSIYTELENTFVNRIKHYTTFKIIGLSPPSYPKSITSTEIKKKETQLIQPYLNKATTNILLDEKGKTYTSIQFSELLNNKLITSKDINFIVGGAYGFSDEAKQQADTLLSLSKMTMPHHLARLVMVEQLYRAFTILKNEKYHNN